MKPDPHHVASLLRERVPPHTLARCARQFDVDAREALRRIRDGEASATADEREQAKLALEGLR